METERINILLNDPKKATTEDLILLKEAVVEFPYAQMLHALLAKVQFQLNSLGKNRYLAKAALYSGDRSVLKKIIQQEGYLKKNNAIDLYQDLPKFALEEKKFNEDTSRRESIIKNESETIFDEVLKNLERLKSLRKQFQFLELNDDESVSEPEESTSIERLPEEKSEKPPKRKKTPSAPSSVPKKQTAKQQKLNEILEKDEQIDSKVNVFFLNEIEKNQETGNLDTTEKLVVQNELIEKFIIEQPSIGSIKKESEKSSEQINRDLSEKSTIFGDDLVSENLAVILLRQGKKDRAIDIYKKLIWKLPQKKAYFAARIEEIKK